MIEKKCKKEKHVPWGKKTFLRKKRIGNSFAKREREKKKGEKERSMAEK